MRKKYSFFGDFHQFFAEEKAEKIHTFALPEVIKALLTRPTIFSDLSDLELLESYTHIILLQLQKFDKFEAEHTKGYKPLTRNEILEKSRHESQALRDILVKKNAERETRIKKEKIRLEKELAKKAKEEALAAKKAVKEARLAAIREAKQKNKKPKQEKEAYLSGEEDQEDADNQNEDGEDDQEDVDNDAMDEPEDEPEEPEDEQEVDQEDQANDQEEEEEGDQEGQQDPDNPDSTMTKPVEFNLLDPILFADPIENIEDIAFSYKKEQYYFEYSIKGHSRLEEYFNALKKGLRSSIFFGKLSYQSLLTPYSLTLVDSIEKLSSLLPLFGEILGTSPSLAKEKRSETVIRNKLKDLGLISANLGDLATSIAMSLTIVRREYLASTESLSTDEVQCLGPLVYAGLKEKKLTDHQILAVIDCKYVEASCLRNLADKNWTVKELPRVRLRFMVAFLILRQGRLWGLSSRISSTRLGKQLAEGMVEAQLLQSSNSIRKSASIKSL